jgi:hypothetical protein
VLLELQCAFDTIRAIRGLGWTTTPTGLLQPPHILQARKGHRQLDLYFQHTPAALGSGSLYGEVQKAHSFTSRGGLIPDLVLRLRSADATRWLLIEVKGGQKRGVADYARSAVLDLLAYRRAYAPVLDTQDGSYGLAYAWGHGLEPSVDAEVTVCTPDTLHAALAPLLEIAH